MQKRRTRERKGSKEMEKKLGRVIHLGIVVEDIHDAVKINEEEFGITPWEISEHADFFADKDVNGKTGVDFACAICREDGYEIELISPVGPSIFADWLKEHGPGIHHVKLETKENYRSVLDMAERISGRKPALDIRFQDGTPIVAYADMVKETGLLVEITNE